MMNTYLTIIRGLSILRRRGNPLPPKGTAVTQALTPKS